MIKHMLRWLPAALALSIPLAASASPEEDLEKFRAYFNKKFPAVETSDYINGAYALDSVARANWEAIEEFPPYEIALEEGEKLFNEPFKNGKGYADCFPDWEKGIKQNYPYFDAKSGQVRTLEQDINQCRTDNGEEALGWKKGKIASISAFLAYKSRGQKINVVIPDDPRAKEAYEKGKQFFYAKRGQLNFSCADCHIYGGGSQLRSEILSPALGHTSHFPVYRAAWGELGTMHRRYGGCNEQVRAKAFDAQSEEYRNLEYFHTYMSNGLELNGPGTRK